MKSRPLLLLLSGGLCGFLLASTLTGAEQQPTVSAKVDRSRITVGDVIRYTVTVSADAGIQVDLPPETDELGDFEVRSYQATGPVTKEGKKVWNLEYALAVFSTGEFKIPPPKVTYRSGNEAAENELSAEAIEVIVESVKPADAEDILDIKAPVEIPRNWWSLWPWFVLAAGLIALGALAFVWYRRRDSSEEGIAAPTKEQLPPHEEAYRALRQLRDEGLVEQQMIKLYYIKISEIIRRYIGRRFQVEAMELTSTEVLDRLRRAGIEVDAHRLFQEFFSLCDLVKFAKYRPSEAQHDQVMKVAIDIVDVTKKSAEAVEEQKLPVPVSAGNEPLAGAVAEVPKQLMRDVS